MNDAEATFPAQQQLLTYQNRLRVIGRQLDLGGYRSVNVIEIPGGFLVRAIGAGGRVPEALEFANDQFGELLSRAIGARGEGDRRHAQHPLLPTGYEDFFRALGYHLDGQHSEALTVAELDGLIAVGGLAMAQRAERVDIVPFQRLLRSENVNALLDAAFRRRGPDAQLAMPVARSMRDKIRQLSTKRTAAEAGGDLHPG